MAQKAGRGKKTELVEALMKDKKRNERSPFFPLGGVMQDSTLLDNS